MDDPNTGRETGRPIPRFVSLKASRANIRSGPDVTYPVQWFYMRSHLPVEIIAEHGHWRRIRDRDGSTGWIFFRLLSGKRTIIATGDDRLELAKTHDTGSEPVAFLEPGVTAVLERCEENACLVEAGGYSGWVRRDRIWGVNGKD